MIYNVELYRLITATGEGMKLCNVKNVSVGCYACMQNQCNWLQWFSERMHFLLFDAMLYMFSLFWCLSLLAIFSILVV